MTTLADILVEAVEARNTGLARAILQACDAVGSRRLVLSQPVKSSGFTFRSLIKEAQHG